MQRLALSDLTPPAELHVVLAAHITGDKRLAYENALALSGSLLPSDNPREVIVEIRDAAKLQQQRHGLPFWERSGVCSSWWLEGEEGFHKAVE